jgi:ribonuclease HI
VRGTIPGRQARPGITVGAADASVHSGRRLMGAGWLCTDGRWGIAYHTSPRRGGAQLTSNLAELAAAGWLLRCTAGDTPAVLATDSMHVVKWFRDWQNGYAGLPWNAAVIADACNVASCAETAGLAAANRGLVVQHVAGHSGHLLNEAADALAKIGRDTECPADQAFARAEHLVAGFLDAWDQLPA